MSNTTIAILILLCSFGVMIICKLPITFALISSTMLTMFYLQMPPVAMVQQMAKAIDSFSLMAVPFFILAGEIMGEGGISRRIVQFADVIVGRVRGGLAQVNCLDSMFFGGISGSAVADVSSLGAVMIPMMEENGYDRDFAVGITVTSACQGVLIPPSHNMIIFSLAAGGVSVGRLFLGGMLPGILVGVSLMIVCAVFTFKRGYPKGKKYTFKDAMSITWDALLALGTAVIIMGGVTLGWFTATESAAIACIYAFFVSTCCYRELKLSKMPKILMNSVKTLALVFSLIAAAGCFGWMMAYLRIPALVTQGLMAVSTNKVVVLLLINALLLVLGCIMDMAPLIVITTPILLPVVTAFGMDPVQFGCMLILNLAVGLCTPPVGSALFVGCAIGKIRIEKVVKVMLPMYGGMIAVLLLVTFVPQISLWLPNMLMPAA